MVFKIKNFYSFTKSSFILRFKFLQFFSGGGGGENSVFGVLGALKTYLYLIS